MSVQKDSICELIPVDRNSTFSGEGLSFAIGFFDGVHFGHRFLIKEAEKSSFPCCVLTFSDDFKSSLAGKKPELLTTRKEKVFLLSSLGVKKVFYLPYSPKVVHSSVDGFLDLLSSLKAKKIVVGQDFSFADKARGKAEDLLRRRKRGCEVSILGLKGVKYKGREEKISSTLIKQRIADKDIAEADSLLVSPYQRSGRVIKGKENGRKINFPTANILQEENKVLPPIGVYRTRTVIDGQIYDSRTNIGTHPTIDEAGENIIETNVFGFSGNLYGKTITVEFLSYLRGQKKFDSRESLRENLLRLKRKILGK